jgi:hypothetical protein
MLLLLLLLLLQVSFLLEVYGQLEEPDGLAGEQVLQQVILLSVPLTTLHC